MQSEGLGRRQLVQLALAMTLCVGCQSLTRMPQPESLVEPAVRNSETELASHVAETEQRPKNVVTGVSSRSKKASHSNEVKKLNVLWSDATAEVGGVPQQSGFAAKVYLIGSETGKPVESEGRFSFYAWNDHSSKHKIEPDRIWSFSAQQVAKLNRTDSVGTYYSFWLPMGSIDHPQLNFSLQAAFTPASGKPVVSQPAAVSLPGRGRGLTWTKKPDILNVRGHQEAASATIKEEKIADVPQLPQQTRVATPLQQ